MYARPTLGARNFPARIQRLIVSGFRPTPSAACAAVSIALDYSPNGT
jgi:hypothetical protein